MIKYLFAIVIILGLIHYGNTALQVTQYSVQTDKLNGGTLKVMHIADFHDYKYNDKTIAKILEEHSPDLIVITGDLIDRRRYNLEHSLEFVDLMNDYPLFYVTGNHEAWSGKTEVIISELKKRDVTVLRNEISNITVNDMMIQIVGLDDPSYQNHSAVSIEDGYSILLSHRLKLVEYYDADISFSGHAHGGQFRLFGKGFFAPDQGFLPDNTSGVVEVGNTMSVISRGMGNSILQLRIFNRPEIVVVTIEGQ